MQPLVSLITVNYNQTEVTCALLDSIRQQEYSSVEVIVVDNASKENPAFLIQSRYPEVIFIRSEENLGFAGGNNLGIAVATGEYLFFVNNDAEITEGCIARLLALFQKVPNLGIASPLICYFPEKGQEENLIQYAGMTRVHPFTARNQMLGNRQPDKGQFTDAQATAYAHGAAMMVPRSVLERVGSMANDFFLYYEELDWCERIRRAGYAVWVEPRARVYHKESLAVQKLGALKTYYLNRNRVYFMRRNYGGWQLALFYVFLFGVTVPKNVLLSALRQDWRNLRAFWQGIAWNFGFLENVWEQASQSAQRNQLTAVAA